MIRAKEDSFIHPLRNQIHFFLSHSSTYLRSNASWTFYVHLLYAANWMEWHFSSVTYAFAADLTDVRTYHRRHNENLNRMYCVALRSTASPLLMLNEWVYYHERWDKCDVHNAYFMQPFQQIKELYNAALFHFRACYIFTARCITSNTVAISLQRKTIFASTIVQRTDQI